MSAWFFGFCLFVPFSIRHSNGDYRMCGMDTLSPSLFFGPKSSMLCPALVVFRFFTSLARSFRILTSKRSHTTDTHEARHRAGVFVARRSKWYVKGQVLTVSYTIYGWKKSRRRMMAFPLYKGWQSLKTPILSKCSHTSWEKGFKGCDDGPHFRVSIHFTT